jgi:hypothetical protein
VLSSVPMSDAYLQQVSNSLELLIQARVQTEVQKRLAEMPDPHPPTPPANPIQPLSPAYKGALSRKAAMEYLSIGSTKLWQLEKTGKIRTTVYGTYPVDSLNKHLDMETKGESNRPPEMVEQAQPTTGRTGLTAEAQEILEELRGEIRRQSSPWADRQAAADYCNCDVTFVDQAANEGKVKRYWKGADPIFKKKDLDKWLETNPTPEKRRGRKAK